jgi:hypothetical protein
MKKQLLIAAVAATMGTAVIADISIKGSANIKMAGKDLSTNTFTTQSSSQNMDVDITGSNGATKVIAHLDIDNAASGGGTDTSTEGGTINVDKLYMTTAIGSVNVKAGDWSSCVGMVEGVQRCTTTDNSISLSTKVGGYTIGVSGGMSDDSATNSLAISGKVAGFDVKIKESEHTYTDIAVKGDLAIGTGTGFYVEHMNRDAADSDATLVAAHTVVNGVTLKAASYEADVTGLALNTGDIRPLGTSLVGDYHTRHADTLATIKDIKGVGANMDIQGNNVNVVVGNYDTTTLNNLDFADVVVTRKLAAGTTLDMSYGKIDTSATADTTNFGAIINVKF